MAFVWAFEMVARNVVNNGCIFAQLQGGWGKRKCAFLRLFALQGCSKTGAIQRGLLTVNVPPPAGGVGGYDYPDSGEEGEWRPPLLYANP